MAIKHLTLGGGCFWCIEAAFNRVLGVTSAVSGYQGGHLPNPTYQDICQGTSGHAEVVRVEYDDEHVEISTLLKLFFELHDPTQLNRQGNDIGEQYRSVLFYQSEAQQHYFTEFIVQLNGAGIWPSPIVTKLESETTFYPAEAYHQDYANQNPHAPYCAYVVWPKLNSFFAKHQQRLKRN